MIKFAFNDINAEDLTVRRIELAQMERPDPRLHVFMQGKNRTGTDGAAGSKASCIYAR